MNRWRDWFEQAERDLRKAGLDHQNEYYEWACFSAHQASEKVLKAAAFKSGLTLWGHSLTEILKILSSKIPVPPEAEESAKLLDMYYIPTRYPNGFPSGKPSDYFTAKQSKEALDAADNIFRFCEGLLP